MRRSDRSECDHGAEGYNPTVPEYRLPIENVEAAEIEGDSLRLFCRRGPFGVLRYTRSYHPPNETWHHVELHRDRVAIVVFKDRR